MAELDTELIETIFPDSAKTLWVAYSGGVDSHVLLHLCASQARWRDRLVAVYVHHGLQSEADAWSVHCGRVAVQLGVKFRAVRVDARPKKGQSPEEAARVARYSVLEELVKQDDVLLVAQHAEDQLETVLLQLFRGAGVSGLAAMPERMQFGKGLLLRPLLSLEKQRILDYAKKQRLVWVEDVSNRSIEYDRNFLRNNVIPMLKQRWPALGKTVSRSARHCAEASELLVIMGQDCLESCYDTSDNSLSIDGLLGFDDSRRKLVLRRWFSLNNLKPPSERFLQILMRDVVGARIDAKPELRCQDQLVKRYRGRLYCVPGNKLLPDKVQRWPKKTDIIQRNNGFCLRLV